MSHVGVSFINLCNEHWYWLSRANSTTAFVPNSLILKGEEHLFMILCS